jgi:hypothetical protein
MPSTMYVRFIRNPADQTSDDQVNIQRTGVDQYELTYTTTNTESGAANTYTVKADDKDVFRWFRSIIGLLEIDMEPFQQVQIDFPAAPSIMIDARHIGDHYAVILDALEVWLDDGELVEEPPKTPPRRTQPAPPHAPIRPVIRNHHLFFDIGDD